MFVCVSKRINGYYIWVVKCVSDKVNIFNLMDKEGFWSKNWV